MRVVKIHTSEWSEETFHIITDLPDSKIKQVVAPMVAQERRETEQLYEVEEYVEALKKVFPSAYVHMQDVDEHELTF